MSCVHLSEGPQTTARLPGGLPPWLVVPFIRSCQSPIRIWSADYLQPLVRMHMHVHM